jgi:hypothetical protein
MTTASQAREAIIARFIASYVPVAFADVVDLTRRAQLYSFDNEGADAGDAAAGESWCRFVIQEADSRQETLGPVGGRRWRREGVARLALYCPSNKGTLKSDGMVKTFRGVFEGVSFSGVYFTNCQVSDLGIEGASWRVDALAQFWFEEIK